MATTPSSGIRYPIASDSPNIAQYFQNLATDLDQRVVTYVSGPAARIALTNTWGGQIVHEDSTGRFYRRNRTNVAWHYLGGSTPPIALCTIVSGWTAIAGRAPVAYLDGNGLVHLQGAMRPSSTYNPNDGAPHTAIELPADCRPTSLAVPVAVQTSTGYMVGGIIGTDGILNFTKSLSTSIASGVDHYLDGIAPFHLTYAGGALS